MKVQNPYRKIKLAKNRRPSDVFAFFDKNPFQLPKPKTDNPKALLPNVAEKIKRPQQIKERIFNERPRKTKEWDAILDKLKQTWPPEKAARIKKKKRKNIMLHFSGLERHVFCWYIKSCRRGNKQPQRKDKEPKKDRRLAYENYINSAAWQHVKNKYYQSHPRICAACGTAEFIHLHHMDYGSFGHEKDEHLIPLCQKHHEEYHEQFSTQRHMIRTTEIFIERTRAKLSQ